MFGDLIGGATYVADCKLITAKMVKLLADTVKPVKFISKCPANFNARLAAKCINEAYEDNNWTDIGVVGTDKDASDHKGCEYIKTVYGRDLRLLVIKSSEREGKYVKKVENELLGLEKDIKSVNAKVFVCKSDAEKEWERFCKEHRNSLYLYDVAYVETRVEKENAAIRERIRSRRQ